MKITFGKFLSGGRADEIIRDIENVLMDAARVLDSHDAYCLI